MLSLRPGKRKGEIITVFDGLERRRKDVHAAMGRLARFVIFMIIYVKEAIFPQSA